MCHLDMDSLSSEIDSAAIQAVIDYIIYSSFFFAHVFFDILHLTFLLSASFRTSFRTLCANFRTICSK